MVLADGHQGTGDKTIMVDLRTARSCNILYLMVTKFGCGECDLVIYELTGTNEDYFMVSSWGKAFGR